MSHGEPAAKHKPRWSRSLGSHRHYNHLSAFLAELHRRHRIDAVESIKPKAERFGEADTIQVDRNVRPGELMDSDPALCLAPFGCGSPVHVQKCA